MGQAENILKKKSNEQGFSPCDFRRSTQQTGLVMAKEETSNQLSVIDSPETDTHSSAM